MARTTDSPTTPTSALSSPGTELVIDGRHISVPDGAVRLDLPRADRLWVALMESRVVVASGEGFISPHVMEGTRDVHDQAIGRPADKLWGSRVDPEYVGARVFAAIARHTAGKRTVTGRRLSTIARNYLAAGPGHVFIGVEGEITLRDAAAVADALLASLMTTPHEPVSVLIHMVRPIACDARLVVIGDASLSFARALGTPTAPKLPHPAMAAWRAPPVNPDAEAARVASR